MDADHNPVLRAHWLFVAIENRALLCGGNGGDEKRGAEQGSQGGERRPSNHGSDRIARKDAATGGSAKSGCAVLPTEIHQ